MTGIIVTTPPTVELPPGSTSSNPATLPPVTYRYALLNIPQTWTAKQTFPLGMITLNAADITGTLPAADLPPPTTITLGGIFSKANVANQWINSIGTDGTPTSTQPAFMNISGIAAASQLPNPTATTLGGIESLAAVGSKWINAISTSGVPSATQPAFTDLTGNATIAQGGTGQVTAGPAFDALSPTTTRGDLIARGAAVNARLALGTSGLALLSNGTDPVWTGFLNPGTGGAIRTWNTKAAEWVSVKDFGALGDNSTFDTTAIQNAINSLSAGGTLYFPPGFYLINAALTISTQGITILGANRLAAVIRTTSATANIFTITGAYARIDSIGLIGTTGTVSTAGSAISTSVNSCAFVNLFISDVFSGINLNGGSNILVRSVKLLNIYGAFGVSIPSGGGNYIVDNQLDPVFYGPYTSASGFGAWAATTAYSLNAVRSANGGFYVCTQAGTSTTGSGPVITAFGTTIVDGTARWLFITATNSIGLNVVANSNFCGYNDISGPWSIGIQIGASDGNIILANTIGQIIGSGIQLTTGATNTLVQGNLVSGAYGQFSFAMGDATAGTATGSRFLGNYINGAGWMGIIIQSANCMANDNIIASVGQITGTYGIVVSPNINGFTICDNTIIASGGMTGPIQVQAGTSDNYKIMGNQGGTGVNSDAGTGNNKTVDPSFGIGYAAGAGGTVTQGAGSGKATATTLSKACGAITMNNAALAAATIVSFVLTNTTIAATDVLVLNHISGGTVGSYTLNAQCASGSATINVRNNTAGSLSDAIVIQFVVIKGAST